MSHDTHIDALQHALAQLQETVATLHLTVDQDQPTEGATVLVDQLDHGIIDVASLLEEAASNAQLVRASHLSPLTRHHARHALRRAHLAVHQAGEIWHRQIASHDRMATLLQMGRERGRQWRDWTEVVKLTIESCREAFIPVALHLAESWFELTAPMAMAPPASPVPVQVIAPPKPQPTEDQPTSQQAVTPCEELFHIAG